MSSFSRIYLGQHYFSDCFFSLLYGLPFSFILEKIYFSTSFGSAFETCFGFAQFSTNRNVPLMIYTIVGCLILILVIDIKPIRFWNKGIVILALYATDYAILLSIPHGNSIPSKQFSIFTFLAGSFSHWLALVLSIFHCTGCLILIHFFKSNLTFRNSLFYQILFYFGTVICSMTIYIVFKESV